MNKRFFITGGGTGGHIYPAIAIADELLKQNNTEIFYIGNPNNLEFNITKDKNYKFLPINSFGMPRKLCFKLLKWIFVMFFAWLKACYFIIKYKPLVVFGTGGYVSAPILFAAKTLKKPFVMHDCDANPGLVTRKLAKYAASISVAFEVATKKLDNKNCFINGNPIRPNFKILTKDNARKQLNIQDKTTITIMGGSQGARTINSSVVKILKELLEKYNIQIFFQTGNKNYSEVINEIETNYLDYKTNSNLIVKPYFDNMDVVLKSTDIAISRAGSLSISELCASGVAAIYIPYPFAAADHQRKNAQMIFEKGAALYLEDKDTNSDTLRNLIENLLNNPEKLAQLKKQALTLAKYDSTEQIINQINLAISNKIS